MADAREYEQLDLFYLGREKDMASGKDSAAPMLLRSKQLSTHGVIIGMTGSGKTGLGIALLEEAALDGIPALVIDPKGDMANLLLSFPELAPDDFKPWLDPALAEQKRISLEQLASDTAQAWREGLADWDQDGDRIRRMREAADFVVYTPGHSAGRSLSIVEGFDLPSAAVLEDSQTTAELIQANVSSLLGLLGIEADPLRSREHILLSSIILDAWKQGNSLSLQALIGHVMQPGLKEVGVLPLEVFFPQAKRMELAMQLNTLIASPAFSAWMQGEPVRIDNFLYSAGGKPRISIFSIAHLSDTERMFFVTLLLGRLIAWMRRQEGSSSLRALLYMDEIFGFFPPTSNPPSKTPMLLLLKQARAFGLGLVLATQNPVDLDYKGLANIGSWFIGRLQTKQDQDRVLAGMGGSTAAFDKETLRRLIAGLKERNFMLYSAHRDEPTLFATRWVMSYLKGPISLTELPSLQPRQEEPGLAAAAANASVSQQRSLVSAQAPRLADAIRQYFLPPSMPGQELSYEPCLLGLASVRIFNQSRGIDHTQEIALCLPCSPNEEPQWERAQPFAPQVQQRLLAEPPQGALFAALPNALTLRKDLAKEAKSLAEYLYRTQTMTLWRVAALDMESTIGESEPAFRQRLASALARKKDEAIAALEEQYLKKERQMDERLRRAQDKLDKEAGDVQHKGIETAISVGSAILGAFLGKKLFSAANASKSAQGMRSASQLLKERKEVQLAREETERLLAERDALGEELRQKIVAQNREWDPTALVLDTLPLAPRKSDIFNVQVCLLWQPVTI